MTLFTKHRTLVRLVAAAMAGPCLGACMKWQTHSLQPEQFRAADSLETARLVLTSGDTLLLRGPVIAGDSLVGRQQRPATAFDSLPRLSVPLTAINKAELRKTDAAASVGLLLGGIAGVALIAGAIWASTNPCFALCPAH